MEYLIKPCGEVQLPEIQEMFNDAIINSTSVYDYKPRSMEYMKGWYYSKLKGNFPVIGLFNTLGDLLGFGTYGTFRNQPAYKYSIEHSIYVRKDMRGNGFGNVLLNEIIKSAVSNNYHILVGGIDADNEISIKLHEKMGFKHAGTIKHAGYKFGKWLDLSFYQLILNTPANPTEE
ncbi:MAG: N-acetyltransferase family protein [Bacteroidota bacterium]|nr:N-acetyltransferase family protein [Bacteroidota bacterium]